MSIPLSDHDKIYMYKHWCITFLDMDIDVSRVVKIIFAEVWFPKYFTAPTFQILYDNLYKKSFIDQNIEFDICVYRDSFSFAIRTSMWYACHPFFLDYQIGRAEIKIRLSKKSLFSLIYDKNYINHSRERCFSGSYEPIKFLV